jgi:hypothetical protein
MELICGACHGHLLAEVPGTTVACPHCGTHVEAPSTVAPSGAQPLELEVEDDAEHVADAEGDTVNFQIEAQIPDSSREAAVTMQMAGEPHPVAQVAGESAGGDISATDDRANSVTQSAPELLSGLVPSESPNGASGVHESELAPELFTRAIPAGFSSDLDSSQSSGSPLDSFTAASEAVASSGLRDVSTAPFTKSLEPQLRSAQGVSRLAFIVVLSYASAMTLACGFLIYQRQHNPGTLDLPDLAPPVQNIKGKKKIMTRPEDKPVPGANVLRLGESRQYGSVHVTPLRVTRGPVEFTFYKEGENQIKDPEGPVLKLHLRFENVSPDQEFIPLDSLLVYSKEFKDPTRKTSELFNPHNFVSNVSNLGTRAKHAYVLDLLPNGAWLVKDQRLDEELAPGKTLETFIPTTAEEISELAGDLVWRFQFRKGYNRESHRGVITLIEVLFNSSQIVDEEILAAEPVDKRA